MHEVALKTVLVTLVVPHQALSPARSTHVYSTAPLHIQQTHVYSTAPMNLFGLPWQVEQERAFEAARKAGTVSARMQGMPGHEATTSRAEPIEGEYVHELFRDPWAPPSQDKRGEPQAETDSRGGWGATREEGADEGRGGGGTGDGGGEGEEADSGGIFAFVFVHKDPLDFVYQVKLFRKYVAEPVHFTAVLNLDELEPEYNRTLARWRVVAASLKVQLLFLPLSCDRMLGIYYPRSLVSYHYLPASLCHGVAMDWVWSRRVLRRHRRDTVMILHPDVFPYEHVSVRELLLPRRCARPSAGRGGRGGGGMEGDGWQGQEVGGDEGDRCAVAGRRWTRCYTPYRRGQVDSDEREASGAGLDEDEVG